MIRTILFDLDETLYPPGAGIMPQIRIRMIAYLQARFGLSLEEAESLRRHYFQTYGTTMRGLQINRHIDPDEFLAFVHEIPLELYLRPNPELDQVLAAIPQTKVVFTNASREHAERVLVLLGIRRHFGRIVDVRDVEYESKPQPAAYQRVCALLGVPPHECLIVEDNSRNLRPAKALGMATVLVQDGIGVPEEGVDWHIYRIEDIRGVIASLSTQPQVASRPPSA